MAEKCSWIGLKVGVWSYYSVDRLPVKFHHSRSPFDAPMDNYSGSIAGLSSDVFGLRKLLPSPLSLFSPLSLTTVHLGPCLPSLHSASNPSRAFESCPEPDPGSRHRWVRIIPKHLQNITVFFVGLSTTFFLDRSILIGGPVLP